MEMRAGPPEAPAAPGQLTRLLTHWTRGHKLWHSHISPLAAPEVEFHLK